MTFSFTAVDKSTPFGLYVMKLDKIEEPVEQTHEVYGTSMRVQWIFNIEAVVDDQSEEQDAEDYIGEDHFAWTSTAFGNRSNARKYAQALLGRTIEQGEQITLDQLVGKRAKVTIGLNTNGNKAITEMVPYREPKAKKPKRAPAPVEDDFDDVEPGDDDEF